MPNPNGPEVHVSRVKKAVFLLHSEEISFFPSQCITVIEGAEAHALHRESVSNFPQASASVVATGALIQPLYNCFVAENFVLNFDRSRCFKDETGFYTFLTFERRGKARPAELLGVERLFASVAESVYFVAKKNSIGVVVAGLTCAHVTPHLSGFDFRSGRIQAYT